MRVVLCGIEWGVSGGVRCLVSVVIVVCVEDDRREFFILGCVLVVFGVFLGVGVFYFC